MKSFKKLKVVILAGGLESRSDSATKFLPRPLVKIGKLLIITHIINIFAI